METNGQDYVESSGTGTGVMVSNLPLLFTRGFPSSLHRMKLDELEDFVPFMVRCSIGEDNPVPWAQLPRPTWWPRKLPFRLPSPNSSSAKRTALINLVERCYSFHGCEYLLHFCASLVEGMPVAGYRFNDNRDGTTSMYHGNTGKLLVTFRNENRDYDKSHHEQNLRKKLLLSPTRVNNSSTTTAVFQPTSTDIYLCDKCENEFYSLREVQIHEKKCCGDAPPSPIPPSPEPEPIEDEPEPAGQVPFLNYFKLQPAKHTGLEPYMSPKKRNLSPPRKLSALAFPRFDTTPLSSPLGKLLLSNSKYKNRNQTTQHLVSRYERHLHATPNTDVTSISGRDRCNNRWIIVWRQSKEEQPWSHLYCFNKAQRRERHLTIRAGLNFKSRRELSKCRSVKVLVKRIPKRVVNRITRLNDPPVAAPCIDLTDEQPKLVADILLPTNYVSTGELLQESSLQGLVFNGAPKISEDPLLCYTNSPGASRPLGTVAAASYSQNNSQRLEGQTQLIPVHLIQNSIGGGGGGSSSSSSSSNSSSRSSSNEVSPAQLDPLSFNPGDIIRHDSISLIPMSPLPLQNALPNSSNISNHIYPPGPKCSKTRRPTLLPTSVQPVVSKSLSNSQLIELSKGSNSILNKAKTLTINLTSVNAVGESSSEVNSAIVNNQIIEGEDKLPNLHGVTITKQANNGSSSSSVLSKTNNAQVKRKDPSIEVIELSSDDDDTVKVWGYSETADNAPKLLDGLERYPHSGAQVPGSSKFSMPKNGNSHWSSTRESHCDAGHVGDLATNGQSPSVLKKSLISPVLSSTSLPIHRLQPVVTSNFEKAKINPRKRHCESPPVGSSGGKLMVLDVSSEGLKIYDEIVTEWNNNCLTNTHETRAMVPSTLLKLDDAQSSRVYDASLPKDSNKSGAFVSRCSVNHNHGNSNPSFFKSLTYEANSSAQSQRLKESESEKDSASIPSSSSLPLTISLSSSSSSSSSPSPSPLSLPSSSSSPSLNCSENSVVAGQLENSVPNSTVSGEKSAFGLLDNIVNTVSKGVEYICSLVGTSNSVNSTAAEDNEIHQTYTQVPKSNIKANTSAEVKKLLGDECRELTRNGLEDLRLVDVPNRKLTRRSVERVIPTKVKRKLKRNNYLGDIGTREHTSEVNQPNPAVVRLTSTCDSAKISKDLLTSVTDENGNSPSYIKSKLNSLQIKSVCDKFSEQTSRLLPVMENTNDKCSNVTFTTTTTTNSIDNSNKNVGQIIGNRKCDNFSDHYRNTNISYDIQDNVEDNNFVKYVNSIPVRLRDSDSSRVFNDKHEDCGRMGNYFNIHGESFVKDCDISQSEVSLLPIDEVTYNHFCALSKSAVYRSGQCAVESSCPLAMGKTAEEGGALQAQVPLSDELEYVLQSGNSSIGLYEYLQPYDSSFQSTSNYVERIGKYTDSGYVIQNEPKSSGEKEMIVSCLELQNLLYNEAVENHCKNKGFHILKDKSSKNENISYGNKNNDSLISNHTKDPEEKVRVEQKKKNTKHGTKRELKSLMQDECKEIKVMGFDHSKVINKGMRSCNNKGGGSLKGEKEVMLQKESVDVTEEIELLDENHGKNTTYKKIVSNSKQVPSFKVSGIVHNLSSNNDTQYKSSGIDNICVKTSKSNTVNLHGKKYTGSNYKDVGQQGFKVSNTSHTENVNIDELSRISNEGANSVKNIHKNEMPKKPCIFSQKKKPSLLYNSKYLAKNTSKELYSTDTPSSSNWSENDRYIYDDSNKIAFRGMHEKPVQALSDNIQDSITQKHEQPRKNVHSLLNTCSKSVNSNKETNNKSSFKEKKEKKKSIPRELQNLGKDEWKEMKNSGFHPADIVGRDDTGSYYISDSENENSDSESDSIQKSQSLLKDSHPCRTNDVQSHKPSAKSSVKLPLELARLLQDECKELKSLNRTAKNGRSRKEMNDLNGMKLEGGSFKRRLESWSNCYANEVLKSSESYCANAKGSKNSNVDQFAASRNTRSQTNIVSVVEVLTPRETHRQILQTETGMCVLNFDLPAIS